MQKLTPFLWYSDQAEEAATFYTSLFPDSRIVSVTTLPRETSNGKAEQIKVVDFTLFGQALTAMSAGGAEPFNHGVSFVVRCADQAELDRYWDALLYGGTPEACGWIKDRFGFSWQLVPADLSELLDTGDPAASRRVFDAVMTMVKLDIAAMRAARAGS